MYKLLTGKKKCKSQGVKKILRITINRKRAQKAGIATLKTLICRLCYKEILFISDIVHT